MTARKYSQKQPPLSCDTPAKRDLIKEMPIRRLEGRAMEKLHSFPSPSSSLRSSPDFNGCSVGEERSEEQSVGGARQSRVTFELPWHEGYRPFSRSGV